LHIHWRCNALSKKTFKIIKNTSNEAILQVKENQKYLLKNCQQITETLKPSDTCSSKEKAHGRIEHRKSEIYNALDPECPLDGEWQKYVKTIIKVTRKRSVFDTRKKEYKTSEEISFYLSTINASAKVFLCAIRAHWGIENINHHVRDETMQEDKSRIRKNPQNMAKLKSFSLNIMRKTNSTNIKNDMFRNSLNIHKLNKKYAFIF